ncbi:hypothetical protein MSAN_00861800 [Mycena sanguinolenta]|uniref:G-protein coupled receptors family 2 profile 2 domain-containing protein n=1 Tax=Mycena sanguinolenta TaxID=230812 RepID=A0A8H6Z066_9AGAR|nr:hypothetical protein MSAN_00861800 [Mycena sanguinolenta]
MLHDHPSARLRLIALLITGVCLSFLVLCAYACTIWNPVSRPCMDRFFEQEIHLLEFDPTAGDVSLGFGLSFLFSALLSKETMPCAFLTFSANLTQLFSAAMFFSMALNLQLVIVHKVNGQKMEKFYYLGAGILATGCSVTPLAAGVYGWNRHTQSCWLVTRTTTETFRWSIATDSFWNPLMAAGEALAALVIIGFFISTKVCRLPRVAQITLYPSFRYRAGTTAASVSLAGRYRSGLPFVKYRYTIIRIGLYPLVSCITNFSTAFMDIYQLTHPVSWRLEVVAFTIYSSRLTVYSLLALTDPSFMRAAKNIWHHTRPSTILSASEKNSWPTLTQISTEFTSNAAPFSAQVSTCSQATHGNQDKAQDRSDDIGTQI